MEYKMRKSEREILDFNDKVNVLHRCDTIRLGLSDEPCPYIVPISFGYEVKDGKVSIFIHGAKEGRKIDLIRKNPCVSVEADICHSFTDTGHSITCQYESVMGSGLAAEVEGEEAMHGLSLLMAHVGYASYGFDESVLPHLRVFRIDLDSLVGKRRVV
jgi:nitroimidazol reductase NimA-like FMN-containing flavoprotein (pyridoxamine 5'-phosphate oxidase superfamily)